MSSQPGRSNPQLAQAQQMFNSLSQGRKIAVVAAVVGLIFSFFPWYGVSVSYGGLTSSASESGWHSWGLIAILAFIVGGALVVLPLVGISVRRLVSALPPTVTDAMLVMGAGAVAAIMIILFMLTQGPSTSISNIGVSSGPSFGAYIALICALAIAAGGYLMQKEPATF